MIDPREDPKTDQFAEPRRLLCQIEAEIGQTEQTYKRIVDEGADHFHELHRRAQDHLDENNVDEYVAQATALATMRDRHAQAVSRFSKA